MYKIGEFSKISMLSIKTLRYYDKENILVPDFRDENGYRYYSEDNFKKSKMILILRELEFSISEMKEVVLNCNDSDDLYYYLNDKRNSIEEEIYKKSLLVKKINSYTNIDLNKKEKLDMYEIIKKEMKSVNVISKRFNGSVKNSGNIIPNLYKSAKIKVNGDMFTLYHDMNDCDNSDIEICLPVKEYIPGDHEYKTLDKYDAITVTHTGPYETLNLAYKFLIDYAHKNNIELCMPFRETCIKGHGMIFKGNPNKYITEIGCSFVSKDNNI